MKKLKVYLDTSVINFLFADDAPEFKKATENFFINYVKDRIYEINISEVVIDEINNTNNSEERKKLLGVIKLYEIDAIAINEEAEILARKYIADKILPERKLDDARHIAISTVNNFDILLSWNFKHLANVNKKQKIKLLNEREGYFYPLDLLTPLQLIYEDY
jgi:hypothetical protein